MFSCEKTKM
ncbi:hypothetical protein Patl1_26057 [Pistacia atlantica]|uniref:Uncharacterized protein n=1 Tax=Pistacia atlantica TaxID=434234 RepID=A0ACC1B0I4_9ROSI|nr:hypothetical protein Patl1_26057 [Pistacia atlantica]